VTRTSKLSEGASLGDDMKLYRISQTINDGYDTYDSAIVAALTDDQAKEIHPSSLYGTVELIDDDSNMGCWAYSVDQVKCEYIGEAVEGTLKGVILASFNAG